MTFDVPTVPGWTYRSGDHWAVVGPTVAALLLGETSRGLACEMWELLAAGADVDSVVEALVGAGLAHLPSFALVERTGASVRTLVRGDAVVDVYSLDEAHARRLDAVRFRSWREDVVQDVTAVDMGAGDSGWAADDPGLPVVGGIVRASSLRLTVADVPLPRGQAAARPVTAVSPTTEAGPPMPEAGPPTPAAGPPVVHAGAPRSADVTLDAAVLEETPQEETGTEEIDLDGGPGDLPQPERQGGEPVAVPLPPVDDYLDLVSGVTRLGTVEDAAVRGADTDDGPALPIRPAPVSPPAPVHEDRAVAAGIPERAEPVPPPAGLISSIPFGTGRPAVRREEPQPSGHGRRPGSAGATPLPESDESELTVVRVPAPTDGDGAPPADRVGWLPAVVCAAGHPNPPESELCRVCRADLSAAAQRWVERPVLGRLRFDGPPGTVQVTGPMVIGRAPRVDGVRGDAVPTMVPVPSAEGDVSRSHLRIAVEGWHVMVIDLDATNGTVVQDPDGESRRLHPREERMIVPGTRVVLADDVAFVFEAQP